MNRLRCTILLLLVAGCSKSDDTAVTLATTTSVRDSGLLDVLLPKFEAETGIRVKVVAVGSGQALELGRRGDADVLLTHAPDAEQRFMAEGYGAERRRVMHNDFVLVGPPADPAAVQRETSIVEAFRRISRSASLFVSRGDESGTHMKERAIWNEAELQPLQPRSEWYVEAGAGMAEALRMASQKGAYTLTDRATFLVQRLGLDLEIHAEGGPLLRNPYSVIVVSPRRHPHVRSEAARRFVEFLGSPTAQETIGGFGVAEHGEPLFSAIDPSGP